MLSGFCEADHPGCGVNRQAMRRVSGARGDVRSHFPNEIQLPLGRIREEYRDQVFESDDPNLQLHELSV